MADNPYRPPVNIDAESSSRSRRFDRRVLFLVLPPLIPLCVHAIVRFFLPGDEPLYHGMFALGAVLVAWGWTQTMVDRFRWSWWRSYFVSCIIYGAVIAAAILAPQIISD